MSLTTFKERYRNHIKSFQPKKYSNETELSKHIWQLKENNQNYNISWSVIKKATPYSGGSKTCHQCLDDNLCNLKADKRLLLNKRSEILSQCKHKRNYHFGKAKQDRNEHNPKICLWQASELDLLSPEDSTNETDCSGVLR